MCLLHSDTIFQWYWTRACTLVLVVLIIPRFAWQIACMFSLLWVAMILLFSMRSCIQSNIYTYVQAKHSYQTPKRVNLFQETLYVYTNLTTCRKTFNASNGRLQHSW